MNEIILYLKEKGYPLFLLSNTNELHFSYIMEQYPIVHSFDEWLALFEVGAKKPHKRIYDAIFEKMDIQPGEVFYVDIISRYVETAQQRKNPMAWSSKCRPTVGIHQEKWYMKKAGNR